MKDIIGYEKVLKIFKRWPSFHDAEILTINLKRCTGKNQYGCDITMEVFVFDMTNEVNELGFYKHKNESYLTFEFTECEKLELDDFNQQNAIESLDITKKQDFFNVTTTPANGGYIDFQCRSIEITNFVCKDGRKIL